MSHTRALAVIAGLLIAAGLPPWGWWPLTICGLALWYQVLDSGNAHSRFGRSLLVGAAWMFPSTLWMVDLTPLGWPLATTVFSVMFGVVGLLTPSERRYRGAVFCSALALIELLRWNWPFGGVPISTLAMVGVQTPLAPAAGIFGSAALVVLLGLAGVVLVDFRSRRKAALLGAIVLGAVPLAALLPWFETNELDTIRVAVVQGGGPQNTRAELCQNRQVFERHMTASQLITEPVDLVLWPEDVVHPAPVEASASRCAEPLLGRDEANQRIAELAKNLGAVVLTGWFERSADRGANLNYVQVTNPSGATVDRYHKVQLVPFGEFVPLRSLIGRFSNELPSRDVRAGTEPAVLDSALGPLGVVISWEVFFDHRGRDAIGNGGAVLLNPTNGSSYWLTIVQSQQIASSRLRALETDRWVLQSAPTGFSALVNPSGDVVARTAVSEQAVLMETIDLREGRTLAVILGVWPVLIGSLVVVAFAVLDSLRQKLYLWLKRRTKKKKARFASHS